jgi:hypothetical protein
MRAANDMVSYTGGHRGYIIVFNAGDITYVCPAGSGHQDTDEWEVGAGPLPTNTYYMHPQRTVKPVTKMEQGTCGAGYVDSGYQEIQTNELGWCGAVGEPAANNHYCHIPCGVGDVEGRCFTPQDCWGTQRIRIEGSVSVPVAGTKKHTTRGGFFLHAGNPDDPVSSGCLKTFNETVFDHVRALKGTGGGRVPLCVGSACPDWVEEIYPYAPELSYSYNGP